jgi:hypothetical protein
MRIRLALLALATASLSFVTPAVQSADVTFTTREAEFLVNGEGSLLAINRRSDNRNYLATNQAAPLLSLRIGGKWFAPTRCAWDARSRHLALRYEHPEARVLLAVRVKSTHVVFETEKVEPLKEVELVLWGSYPIAIREMVGEVIGVVRDSECAVGIQALNIKTLGGYPNRENDIEEDFEADDPGHYEVLPDELRQKQLFRADTAKPTPWGSVIHAYCRNRNKERIIENWGFEKYVAPPYDDGGVVGSKIALFACSAAKALETIGEIEVAEGLPHPMLDGVWAKTATNATASYLIVDFSENNIDRAIEMTRRAGLNYLYHSSPFETWGHFELKKSLFPNGREGLRACVEKARKAGVRVGFHTLSNFITPNDAYVTPKPDPRLARVGASALSTNVDAAQKEILVASPDFFQKKSTLNTVVIGEELIRYSSVSEAAPWRLMECQRGAFGTKASSHPNGATVGRLMDHGYQVFLTDAHLTAQVAQNIAALCNFTGTRQISLDGLEGAWSTAMGQYGRTLFSQTWYNGLDPELRGSINDASNPGHFNWHSNTRMNWGEPWYAGFRESQTLYRFKNQLHYERNLMPRMLGWFALRQETSIEDVEWLLARAAGFDAGFALASSLASTAQLEADASSVDAAKQFGALPAILDALRQWETARMSGAFPADVKRRLCDNAREFHLEVKGALQWDLFEAQTARYAHDAAQSSPKTVTFTNVNTEQPLRWALSSTGKQPLSGVVLTVNGKPVASLGETALLPGGSLTYRGGEEAILCDQGWKEVGRVPVKQSEAVIRSGAVEVSFGCAAQKETQLKLELRTMGGAQRLGAR